MDAAICFSHHSEEERACVRTLYICLLGRGCSHFVMVLHHRPVQPFPVGDPSPCTFAESSLDSSIAQSCFCPSPCGGLQRAMPFQVVKEGQQALITNQQGNSRVVVGPRRVRERSTLKLQTPFVKRFVPYLCVYGHGQSVLSQWND